MSRRLPFVHDAIRISKRLEMSLESFAIISGFYLGMFGCGWADDLWLEVVLD
jgi:hypothetical protein